MTILSSKLKLLLFASLVFSSSSLLASYKDAIQDRTDRYNGISGKWYRLKTTDWTFYEGEAAAQYNLGAIAEGTPVEVLKWNRFMARVRLPDGRVVFVRNRLLTESSAPSSTEIKSQAAVTAGIGREKLHGGDPYVHASKADLSGKLQIDSALNSERIPTPIFRSDLNKDQKTLTSATTDVKPAVDKKPKTEFSPIPFAKAATDVKADQPVDRNGRPVRVIGNDINQNQTNGVQLNQADAKVEDPQNAIETIIAGKTPENTPIPAERPADQPAETVTLYNGEKCDPTAKWQSPIREKYRVRDCVATSRDGGGRRHAGIDMAGANPGMQGVPIFPTAPGRIIYSGHRGGYGCLVIVQHDSCPKETTGQFAKFGKCQTRYAHMATRTIKRNGRSVKVCDVPAAGQRVNTCDRIGRMSGTGKRASPFDFASHLHFEMRSESESTVFNPLTTIAGIKNSPDYNAAGSVSCNAVKNSVAFSVPDLNRGRTRAIITRQAAEGVE